LKVVTAKAVAKAMVEIMLGKIIPLRILSDQGSQFDGKLAKELYALLQVEIVQTTPYPNKWSCGTYACFTGTNFGQM